MTNYITFDDVLLRPGYSEVLPAAVNIISNIGGQALNVPILSAAMDTVTESKLAIAIAHEGGLGVIHKNMSIAEQVAEVVRVKNYEHGMVRKPLTVSSNQLLAEVSALAKKQGFSGMPVVDNGKLVGIITNRDMRFRLNDKVTVAECMTPLNQLVTVTEGTDISVVENLMYKHRVEKILVINAKDHLVGMYTVRDILQSQKKPIANKDTEGQLRVAAAVGVGQDAKDRSQALIEAGVDLLVVDTAHGHSKGVIEHVKWLRTNYPKFDIMAGNIATAEAAEALAAAGANIVKVGIGPGSICTTRVVAGVGVPQISAISEVAAALKGKAVSIVADGGIRYSGDLVKAIAAGAHAVMLGSVFAGTEESPGTVELYQGRVYKSYRGMGSVAAMAAVHGSSDRYFQSESSADKLVPEGVEGRVAFKGSLANVMHQFIGGLRAGMGYVGAKDISEMHSKSKFCTITAAGVKEGHVHDVHVTKEAPNYSKDD